MSAIRCPKCGCDSIVYLDTGVGWEDDDEGYATVHCGCCAYDCGKNFDVTFKIYTPDCEDDIMYDIDPGEIVL